MRFLKWLLGLLVILRKLWPYIRDMINAIRNWWRRRKKKIVQFWRSRRRP